MSRLLTVAIWLCLLLAAPSAAYAQAKKGDAEVQISGNTFTVITADAFSTNGQFQFGFGYFFTDRFEIAVSPVVTVQSDTFSTPVLNSRGQPTGATTLTTTVDGDLGLSTKVQFFFGATDSKVKPSIGATYIIQSFKVPDGGTIADNSYLGGNLGIRNYFSENAALDMNLSYGFQPNRPGDYQLIQFNIGIAYVF